VKETSCHRYLEALKRILVSFESYIALSPSMHITILKSNRKQLPWPLLPELPLCKSIEGRLLVRLGLLIKEVMVQVGKEVGFISVITDTHPISVE